MGGDKSDVRSGEGKEAATVSRDFNGLWLQEIIDSFASEYGWTKADTLGLFMDELEPLYEAITKRKAIESALRLKELAQAAIVPNMKTHDQRDFFRKLDNQLRKKDTVTNVSPEDIKRQNDMMRGILGLK